MDEKKTSEKTPQQVAEEQERRARLVKHRDALLHQHASVAQELKGLPQGNRHERRKAVAIARKVARKATRKAAQA